MGSRVKVTKVMHHGGGNKTIETRWLPNGEGNSGCLYWTLGIALILFLFKETIGQWWEANQTIIMLALVILFFVWVSGKK